MDKLDEMDGLIGHVPKDEPTPETPATPEVKEEVAVTVEPVKVEPVKVEPLQEDPTAQIRLENERLRQELNELARKAGPVAPTEAPLREIKPEPARTEVIQFLTNDEAEEFIDNPAKMNEFLNRVYQAGRERTMQDMPQLVRQQTMTEMALQQMVTKFWADNSDLGSYKDFVGMVANQVEIEHPDWGYDKVFTEAATLSRTRLNLSKSPDKGGEVSASPALPSGRRGSRSSTDAPVVTDDQQRAMDELLNFR